MSRAPAPPPPSHAPTFRASNIALPPPPPTALPPPVSPRFSPPKPVKIDVPVPEISSPLDLNSLPPPPPELLELLPQKPLPPAPGASFPPPLAPIVPSTSPVEETRASPPLEVFPPVAHDSSTAPVSRRRPAASGPKRPQSPLGLAHNVTNGDAEEAGGDVELRRRRSTASRITTGGSSPEVEMTSPVTTPSTPREEGSPSSIASGNWVDALSRRSTLTRNASKQRAELKKSTTYSGKTASLALRGTVLDLTQNPFSDFPEIRFKEFPKANLELEKEHLKTYLKVKEQLLKDREKITAERDMVIAAQQKRDEVLMKEFQSENNRRAQQRLKEFQRRHKQLEKERKSTSDALAATEIKKESEEFERALFQDLQKEQSELERRLLNNRLKWVMPWFQNMKATELLQYTHIHQTESQLLEEMQQLERQRFQESQEQILELDLKGFDKQLKMTMKERKTAKRPMLKEEAEWEREVFQQNQEQRLRDQMKQLEEDQQNVRDSLEQKQQKQLGVLENYYHQMESLLLTPNNSTPTSSGGLTQTSAARAVAAEREASSSGSALRAAAQGKYATIRS